jgi:hypothetical protein
VGPVRKEPLRASPACKIIQLHENKFMTVKMALRVVEMIELFAQEKQPLALSEMARLLEMPVSTTRNAIFTVMNLFSCS